MVLLLLEVMILIQMPAFLLSTLPKWSLEQESLAVQRLLMVISKTNIFQLVLDLILPQKYILKLSVTYAQMWYLLKNITILSGLWEDPLLTLLLNAHLELRSTVYLLVKKSNKKRWHYPKWLLRLLTLSASDLKLAKITVLSLCQKV